MCLLHFTFHLKEKKTIRFQDRLSETFLLVFPLRRGYKTTVGIPWPTVSSHCEPGLLLEHFNASFP